MEACSAINQRLKKVMADKKWKIKDLADAAQIIPSQLSRMLAGKRPWTLQHLESLARALGVQPGDLVDDRVGIPIIGKITASAEYSYPAKDEEPLGYIPLPRVLVEQGCQAMTENFYGLVAVDDSLEPFIPKGSKLIVCREKPPREGRLAIYCDDQNKMWLGRVFSHNEHVLLRSLSEGYRDKILPSRYLNHMDRVVGYWEADDEG
jgi:DNA-binding Xre family transcriptional regulator